ncbi:hypothetical protein FRC08_008452 [Ceratobasidium sp. 394]|nr:hypothetical protein FRC08_008452 [Ceratobasidium sp. 394]
MPLPPILTHLFPRPLPYLPTLIAQNKIHNFQLEHRRANPKNTPDVLLLLQHRPVYTAGRRQKVEDLVLERSRLENIGADWVQTDRGGQTTYHGPGQLTAYPLLDIGRMKLPVREYICQLELSLRDQLRAYHNIAHYPSEHTGVFLSPIIKIASIGVHVRHRLTTHGIAMNITREPRAWFDQVVACGLDGVRAGSIEGVMGDMVEREVNVDEEAQRFAGILVKRLGRESRPLDESYSVVWEIVKDLEKAAIAAGPWPTKPTNIKD